MLRLYLIRHGQSLNNIKLDVGTHEFDPPLTDLGTRQADALANYLNHAADSETAKLGGGYGITHLITSPMRRALQTTYPVAQALKLKPEIWVQTHERGGVIVLQTSGVYHHPGMTRSEIAQSFPTFDIPHQITDDGWWKHKRGLETQEEVARRAQSVAEELQMKASYATQARIALITHGTFLQHLIQTLIGDPTQTFLHHNTGITRLDMDSTGRTKLRYVDRIIHLQPNLLS